MKAHGCEGQVLRDAWGGWGRPVSRGELERRGGLPALWRRGRSLGKEAAPQVGQVSPEVPGAETSRSSGALRAGPRLPPGLAAASAWAGRGDAAQPGLALCCGLGPGVLSASVPFMRLSEQFPQVRGWPGAQRQAVWHGAQEASATVPSRVDAAASVLGCGPVSGWQGLGWSLSLLS